MKVSENGLCKVSEQYFVDFASPRHMFNKQENRPYFLAIRGENNIIWLVPLSSKTAKYRAKIEAIRSKLRRYLALVRRGKLRPAVDILSIERVLLNRQQNQSFIV